METFVLRLWGTSPNHPVFEEQLRGIVDHVASGERVVFMTEQELVEAIQRLRGASRPENDDEGDLM